MSSPSSAPSHQRVVKVAIVGSGLAGLTAGYLLSLPVETQERQEEVRFEVHVFEKSSELGMDSASVSIPLSKDGKREWRIDVPMRSFQGGYYPNVIALYRKLGAAFIKKDFTYSFSFMSPPQAVDTARRITTTWLYNGSSGRYGASRPTILGGTGWTKETQSFALYLIGEAWGMGLFILLTVQMFVCYLLTLWHALPLWREKALETMTVGDWVMEVAPSGQLAQWTKLDVAWRDYVETVFLPLMSAMTTSSEDDVLTHPVEEILDYCWLTLGTPHYVLKNGVREVVSRLAASFQNVHLSSAIVSIRPDPQDPSLVALECVDGQVYSGFHHLVFATQASSAVPLLGTYMANLPSDAETQRAAVMAQIRCLKSFKYRTTIVINHTDESLLPEAEHDRRDLNLVTSGWTADEEVDESLCVDASFTMATQIQKPPPGSPPNVSNVYQTTNPFVPPRKDRIISVSSLERAVLDLDAKAALAGLCEVKRSRWGFWRREPDCALGSLQGAGGRFDKGTTGVWICGSYAHQGIPLLEGCVVSAKNVVVEGILQKEGLKLREEPWSI